MKTKFVSAILFLVLLLVAFFYATVASGNSDNSLYMPLVYHSPADTPTPEPTPTPDGPPDYIWDETGESCAWIHSSRLSYVTDGVKVSAQVPSVCSKLVIHSDQVDGLVIVKSRRIKTNTYGCMQSDFGPLVEWPPVDDECPPSELPPPTDEWGRPLWGDYESVDLNKTYKTVCGYCEECDPPHTLNCVETIR